MLESIVGNEACIAPGDGSVSYQVLLPAYLAGSLGERVGERVSLHTIEYLESPNQGATFVPRVVGFGTPKDREFFALFTTVKGIGNRKALRALAWEPGIVARAIASRDVRGLTELPEIGKRLAETIVAELSGKVEGFLTAEETAELGAGAEVKGVRRATAIEDTISALMALGETRADAERLVDRVIGRDAEDLTPEMMLPVVLRARGR